MPRQHFNADWVFSFVRSLGKVVEENSPREVALWPLLREFNFDAYEWRSSYAAFVLRDKQGGVPAGPSARTRAPDSLPAEAPTVNNIAEWQASLAKAGGIGPRDAVFVVPLTEGESIEDDWANYFTDNDRAAWSSQITSTYRRLHLYMSGWDAASGFFLPPGYEHLRESCGRFFADHSHYETNVFIMTRFATGNRALTALDMSLRTTLRSHGFNPVRADDKVYPASRNLWDNVCTYMLCSKRGIAVLENRGPDEFNPNVALEFGFMKALNRDLLLFKEAAFNKLVADLVGTLYETFDITDLGSTLSPAVVRWLRDLGLPTPS